MLDTDPLLTAWMGLTPFRQVIPLNGCAGASTTSFTIPPSTPTGITVYFAGVSWDLAGNIATSVSKTSSFVTE